MSISRFASGGLIAILLSCVSGCSDSGVQEIKDWMADVKKNTHVMVAKLSEPKKFVAFVYGAKDGKDPYNPTKLTIVLDKLKASSNSGIKAPDMERRREALESYPLDSIKMVGTLRKPNLNYALLQVDKSVFKVKVGDYIGQNFGMITSVADTQVDIKEVVQDASGDWIERKATLELQETKK